MQQGEGPWSKVACRDDCALGKTLHPHCLDFIQKGRKAVSSLVSSLLC